MPVRSKLSRRKRVWAAAGGDAAPKYVKINGIGKVEEIRDAIYAGLGG